MPTISVIILPNEYFWLLSNTDCDCSPMVRLLPIETNLVKSALPTLIVGAVSLLYSSQPIKISDAINTNETSFNIFFIRNP